MCYFLLVGNRIDMHNGHCHFKLTRHQKSIKFDIVTSYNCHPVIILKCQYMIDVFDARPRTNNIKIDRDDKLLFDVKYGRRFKN